MWEMAKPPPSGIPAPYPPPPFKSSLSGTGMVEASSQNILIGSPLNRIIKKVLVKSGEKVKKGEILLTLEDQDLLADLAARQVEYEIAKAKLQKMESLPRQEDLIAAEAALKSAEVDLKQSQNQYQMVQGLEYSRALSQQEIDRRRFSDEQAQARWHEAQAHLNKVKGGAWKPDLKIASLEILQAKAGMERIEADIQRTLIRSPIDGTILQINVHEGESPTTIGGSNPLMVIGNIDHMSLKVSINQFDAPRFRSDAPAVAYVRGNPHMQFPLEFIQLEPYLVNKYNLTHDIGDKVDTRVLQVTYLIKANEPPLFVGQQMDVFIQAEFLP